MPSNLPPGYDTFPPATDPARRDTAPVLVTGATGMLGTFVVAELRRLGHPVRLLRRATSFRATDPPPDHEVITGDLTDLAGLRRAAAARWITAEAPAAFGHPDVDVAAMQALAEAWAGHCPGGFVFVSTTDVYGRPRHTPATEDHPLDPGHSDYARGKIRCEEILQGHGRDDVTILRPPYVWGPHPYCRWQLRAAAGHAFFTALLPRSVPGRVSGVPSPARASTGRAACSTSSTTTSAGPTSTTRWAS